MLYYTQDYSIVQPLAQLMDSVESLLEAALPESRPPVHANIHKWTLVPPGNQVLKTWADSMWLNPGFGTQGRVDAVVNKLRQHFDEPNCAMSLRWIPNFAGSGTTSFDILEINPQMRTEGGTYAHFIALSGGNDVRKRTVRSLTFRLVLPFDYDSPELGSLMEAACAAGLKMSPKSLRGLERTQFGGFETRRIRSSSAT
jgi:hypothetical protein